MAQSKKKSEKNSLWLPIELWNLNELFSTESVSPISFYRERNFGNPVNRNQGMIEDTNNLILFDEAVQNSILLEVSHTLLDSNFLTEIKSSKKVFEEDTNNLHKMLKEFPQAKAYVFSQEKQSRLINKVELLFWAEGLKKLFH